MSAKTPDEIWQEDRFNRREDAIAIQAFIESIWDREKAMPQGRAYTLAVDATYGVGKTFFLKRLEEHLSINHPVAYVDAWRDDLADDPLVALLATLKAALKDYISEEKPAANKWKAVAKNAGAIVGIAGKGLLKRAAIAVATGGAVNKIDEILDGASEEVVNATKEAAKDAVDGAAEDLKGAVELIQSGTTLDRRIQEFDAGTKAITDLKDSLRELVKSLDNAPIVIIVDELDRCRPNYAVKLLEEVKHLFDVQGLVFIFGLHGDQLAKSICAEYGEGFDGEHYLRRFINRAYHLPDPDLGPLVEDFLDRRNLGDHLFVRQAAQSDKGRYIATTLAVISAYLNGYKLTSRDALTFLDALEVCVAMAGGTPLILPALLPKLFRQLQIERPLEGGGKNYQIEFNLPSHGTSNYNSVSKVISAIEDTYDTCINGDMQQLQSLINSDSEVAAKYFDFLNSNNLDIRGTGLGHPRNYMALVRSVGRFSTPQIQLSEDAIDLGYG